MPPNDRPEDQKPASAASPALPNDTDRTIPAPAAVAESNHGKFGPTPPPDAALEVRLEASRAAQERTRLAFFASTIITLAMVTGAWNAYLSFYQGVAFNFSNLTEEGKNDKGERINNLGTQALQKEILTAWVRSRMINVSLLGISVGVDDASTVGSMALLVALIWFYFAIRRENHTIGRLLIDYEKSSSEVRWLIFHAINSYTVFSNVGQSDDPIVAITGQPVERQVRSLRIISDRLYYFPFVGLCFLIALEMLSFFRASPFRPAPFDTPVIAIIWKNADTLQILTILFWRLVAILLAVPVFLLCKRITWFDQSTEQILRMFVARLRSATG